MLGIGVEDGTRAKSADKGRDMINEAVINLRHGDHTLNTNAVLACGLESPANKNTGYTLEITVRKVVKEDGRVLATKLDAYRCQSFGGGSADVMRDMTGAYKGNVGDRGVRREVFSDIRPAGHGLDEVGGMTAGDERTGGDAGEVRA